MQGPPWSRVSLDEIATRGSGHTPDKKRAEYWNGRVRWVSLKDTFRLDQGLISETTESITHVGLSNSSAVVHPSGSVVLLRDAGIGKSAVLQGDMAVSQHFMAWNCGPRLDNWFLYYYLQSMKAEFERISNGSTIKTIGLDYFRQLAIPLPDIQEQRLISRMLIDVDDLIASLEQVVVKKQAIKQGLMQQLLAGRTRLPGFSGDWVDRQIGDFADVRAGGTPSTVIDAYWGGEIPWMSSGEVHQKQIHRVVGRITRLGLQKSAARLMPPGTVLMALAGQGKTRGTVAVSRIELTTNQSIAGISPSGEHDSDYLYYNLDSRYSELRGESAGDGGRGGLNLAIIKRLRVPFPSREEQAAIARVLLESDAEIEVVKDRVAKARSIKQGMMQELLTGQTRLPVQEVTTA
ncbi:restriction endonuclease subunit S [Streptomyces xanthophaeus]